MVDHMSLIKTLYYQIRFSQAFPAVAELLQRETNGSVHSFVVTAGVHCGGQSVFDIKVEFFYTVLIALLIK